MQNRTGVRAKTNPTRGSEVVWWCGVCVQQAGGKQVRVAGNREDTGKTIPKLRAEPLRVRVSLSSFCSMIKPNFEGGSRQLSFLLLAPETVQACSQALQSSMSPCPAPPKKTEAHLTM